MVHALIVLINLSISILLLSLISWFEVKESEIETINAKHIRDIEKLKKIPKINEAIKRTLRPVLKVQPTTSQEADMKLIKFFDRYAEKYHFTISQYIYQDSIAHYLVVSYEVDRDKRQSLESFMKLKFPSGFIQFSKFELKEETLKGVMQLVQPYSKKDENVSQ